MFEQSFRTSLPKNFEYSPLILPLVTILARYYFLFVPSDHKDSFNGWTHVCGLLPR